MKRSSVKSNITGYEVCMTLSQEGHINATFRNIEEGGDVLMPRRQWQVAQPFGHQPVGKLV